MKIKRVALVHSSGAIAYFTEEYPAFVRDIDILNMLYEVGKNVWYGNKLYKVCVDSHGNHCYFRYEVFKVRIQSSPFYIRCITSNNLS